ncbi:NADH dehydrogenase (ubiquinone) B16.6 subunit [Nomia melanderi]|uniref:NADH dehydrogenase (ubiquinone) B16.6 subunit n=1 Tax=Nomia melanderi TaxID=2448451 RepID=UPI0013045B11|nr:NADH dehydrogenase [ubiquinone] 1 alpha subcomplex subunit 13 [Nomia melanderi]
MANGAGTRFQDLPPKGGYAPFEYERIPLRGLMKGRTAAVLLTGVSVLGYCLYGLNYKKVRIETIEMMSAKFAIQPLLEAERDRAILKLMKRAQAEEADLMKNYAGWNTGKLFDEPVYKTLPKDTHVEPMIEELVIHSDPKDSRSIFWNGYFF